MSLRPDTARRLAFIRLLLDRASEESRLGAPFSFDSINRFHDAVEMFLALAAQELNAAPAKDFMRYWDTLSVPLGRPLAYRAQAERFNKARVSWKHHGVEPGEREVEVARTTARGLLEDECPDLFGVELSEVSLAIFVSPAVARELVESAERYWGQGEDEDAEAFADLADAFDQMVGDYFKRKSPDYRGSIFEFTPDMTFFGGFYMGKEGKDRDFHDKVIESLQALDRAIAMVGIGVDLKRYGLFKSLTPTISSWAGGRRSAHERLRATPRSTADFEFCRDFVISTAIRLGEFDYDLSELDYIRGASIRRGRLGERQQADVDGPGVTPG